MPTRRLPRTSDTWSRNGGSRIPFPLTRSRGADPRGPRLLPLPRPRSRTVGGARRRSGLGGRGLLFLGFDQFAFKANLELIADNQSAVQHHVERHPIVSSIDLALAAIGNAMAHHRVVELAKVGTGE